MPDYDIIIIGAGAAGLSLATALVESSWRDRKILLIDPDLKQKNDRTWCFWSKDGAGLQPIAYRIWDQLGVINRGYRATLALKSYQYWMVRAIDFYEDARQKLAGYSNVTWLQARVSRVQDQASFVKVEVGNDHLTAEWVFDSRPPELESDPKKYHYLKQHFKGWVVRSEGSVFSPGTATLFDFRTPQYEQMRFFYVLPFDANTALVEYTLFSADLLKEEEYDEALRVYLHDVLKVESFEVVEEERGVIPMSDQPLVRRLGQHIMAIGTRGGRVKASSGYAFLRIQNDTKAIIHSLETTGNPFYQEKKAWRYPIFDRIMLQVMHRSGGQMARIFTRLFQRNSIERIFQFLDEEGSLWQDLRLIGSLPWWPFLRALWRIWVIKKI